MSQMVSVFGEDAKTFKEVLYKSWHHDEFTTLKGAPDIISPLEFGSPEVSSPFGNIHFAGTETTPYHNGHMNGEWTIVK